MPKKSLSTLHSKYGKQTSFAEPKKLPANLTDQDYFNIYVAWSQANKPEISGVWEKEFTEGYRRLMRANMERPEILHFAKPKYYMEPEENYNPSVNLQVKRKAEKSKSVWVPESLVDKVNEMIKKHKLGGTTNFLTICLLSSTLFLASCTQKIHRCPTYGYKKVETARKMYFDPVYRQAKRR